MRGVDSVAIPPTLQALLATRIDRLEPEERKVIERASHRGTILHRAQEFTNVP